MVVEPMMWLAAARKLHLGPLLNHRMEHRCTGEDSSYKCCRLAALACNERAAGGRCGNHRGILGQTCAFCSRTCFTNSVMTKSLTTVCESCYKLDKPQPSVKEKYRSSSPAVQIWQLSLAFLDALPRGRELATSGSFSYRQDVRQCSLTRMLASRAHPLFCTYRRASCWRPCNSEQPTVSSLKVRNRCFWQVAGPIDGRSGLEGVDQAVCCIRPKVS